MTPRADHNDALASVAALVVVMAAIAALTARFGVSYIVAILCALIAVFGTWRLLAQASPDTAEPVIDVTNESQRSSSTPLIPVPGTSPPTHSSATVPAPSSAATVVGEPGLETGLLADTGWLGGTGRLPEGAQALVIDAPEEWAPVESQAYTLGRFDVRAASRIGTDHEVLKEVRQDSVAVARAGSDKYLIVVMANGVRTADNAHLGSYWASRLLARNIELHLRDAVPGVEKMLDRTRTDLRTVFNERFNDGTKLRTIATRLVGLIIPVDGGPAAGFRVGDGDLMLHGPLGWSSVFGEPPPAEANMVFPRVSKAEVVSIDVADGPLLLAGDGVHEPLRTSEQVATRFAEACRSVPTATEFEQLLAFDLETARQDRTAVGVWFTPTQ